MATSGKAEWDVELSHLKGFFNPSHNPRCDLNAILVTAVTEWLKALLLCHPCPLSVFLSFSLVPERSAIRNMPRDTIGKNTGPYGAIVTSVKVSTSSCIRQNEPLRTTITSSTNKCLLLHKKKKKTLWSVIFGCEHTLLMSHMRVPQGSLCYTLSAFRPAVSKTTASYWCSARYTKMQLMETSHRVEITTAVMAIAALSTVTGLEWKPFKQLVIALKLRKVLINWLKETGFEGVPKRNIMDSNECLAHLRWKKKTSCNTECQDQPEGRIVFIKNTPPALIQIPRACQWANVLLMQINYPGQISPRPTVWFLRTVAHRYTWKQPSASTFISCPLRSSLLCSTSFASPHTDLSQGFLGWGMLNGLLHTFWSNKQTGRFISQLYFYLLGPFALMTKNLHSQFCQVCYQSMHCLGKVEAKP